MAGVTGETGTPPAVDLWRFENLGRLLGSSLARFQNRVLQLMAEAGYASTRLSHVRLTQSLDRSGTRISTLARRSAMTKQAMGELIDQCIALGIVQRSDDPHDKRARIIAFTAHGLQWLKAFEHSILHAEREMAGELGAARLEAMRTDLLAYGASFNPLNITD